MAGGQPPFQTWGLAPTPPHVRWGRHTFLVLMPDAEQEQKDDQKERCAEEPEQDQDHLRVLLYIRVVRSDATAVLPKPVERVR